MIFTRKAAIGFILLAILTFSVATVSYQNQPHIPKGATSSFVVPTPVEYYDYGNKPDKIYVVKQGIDLGENTPMVITSLIELITMVGYVGLKKVEPRIKMWEEKVKARSLKGGK